MVGESEENVKRELRALEESGVIVKYTAITNSELENAGVVEALIEVKVTPKRLKGFDEIAEEINRFREVRSLYLMSGGYDIAIFVEEKRSRTWRVSFPKSFPRWRECSAPPRILS